MPIEIRRFGVGHRRPEGPAGSVGIEGRVIHSDPAGVIAELAFRQRAAIAPHSNPNTTWLLVIEGGGWVQVGDERTRVTAGDAVLWPPDVAHGAWTEGAHMRAIVVELAAGAAAPVTAVIEGTAVPALPALPGGRRVTKGEGRLAPRPARPAVARDPDAAEGEPT